MANVSVLREVPDYRIDDWQLCFQFCRWHYDDGTTEEGYRFIWRRPDGSLQPARGQARIPSKADVDKLLNMAQAADWYK